MIGAMPQPTSLERALDGGDRPTVGPLDVLAEARERWSEDGRLDMGALAAGMGLSRATLYRWVGSKERLLGEVCRAGAQESWEVALEHAKGSGADLIADAIERYMSYA